MAAMPLVITEAALREAGFKGGSDPIVNWAVEVRPLPLDCVEAGTRHNKGTTHRFRGRRGASCDQPPIAQHSGSVRKAI